MWKKLMEKVRFRGEQAAPTYDLNAELRKLASAAAPNQQEAAGEPIARIRQELVPLTLEQLQELIEQLWDELGATARDLLRERWQATAKEEQLLADLTSTNKQKNSSAASISGKLQVEKAIPQLVQLLGSSDLGVVLTAAAALGNFQPVLTLPLLLASLDEPQLWPPARVADVLVGYGPGIVPSLVQAYWQKQGPAQESLLEILGQLQSEEGIPAICGALASPEPCLRQKGALAAGKVGGPLVLKPLKEVLQDEVPAVRAQALEALAQIAPDKAAAQLPAALLDGDRLVRSRAAGILAEQQELPRELWAILGKRELNEQDSQLLRDWLATQAKKR